ncbi:hypothetical protein FEM48_Zijuj09G0161100 [Ziziphus jujuba var. spinosa]|uniref:(RS)-norcoclaurine 6-O-methyltransferase-like n=1 Tax=Ziziphus jujuba var. spinosa TaxID=714518 RepID=A0A978UTZ0_ZIZJJ|nr:hypothetical protein FEM48_Zijuj09G0161100 [Ziziphus jujuba var. spinosa]
MAEIHRELKRVEEEVLDHEQAKVEIWKYVFGYVEMAVVKSAIELGIAETIETHGNSITLSELSSTLGCSPSHLHRIMRFLIHRGIFKQTNTSQSASPAYSQTPLSRLLMRSGQVHSMAAFLLLESSPPMLAPWHGLSARIRSAGSSPFEAANGEDWVLHDWGDEECIQILKKCKEAIPKDKGKVIIVEAVIEEEDEKKDKLSDVRLMLDMVMMAHTSTGKERTWKEWEYVLGQVGFTRRTIRPIDAVQSIIEAFP